MTGAPLRIGILGAARIAPQGVIKPARAIDGVEVTAIAARDHARAGRFASRHDIPRALASYDTVIEDPDIDAIYNPLPNSLHARWTLAAIAAGKHVLCEKPFTSNAEEAERVAAAADDSGLVVMEAFHYRYHPLAEKIREVVASGELGDIEHVDTRMCIPLPKFSDIRYSYALAGGATMDVGCYALHMNRLVVDEVPDVVSATPARLRKDPEVDRAMSAELRYPSGARGTMHCSMWSRRLLDMTVRVTGSDGSLKVVGPTVPQLYHRMTIKSATGTRREKKLRTDGTYTHQLRAFVDAVRDGGPVLTDAREAVTNMHIIDAVYDAAGMKRRGGVDAV